MLPGPSQKPPGPAANQTKTLMSQNESIEQSSALGGLIQSVNCIRVVGDGLGDGAGVLGGGDLPSGVCVAGDPQDEAGGPGGR